MKGGSELKVEIQDDGSIKVNATKMIGTEKELIKDLESLARALGGELTIEEHVHGHNHSHSHDHTHSHDHKNKS
jgi:hypothetical protein